MSTTRPCSDAALSAWCTNATVDGTLGCTSEELKQQIRCSRMDNQDAKYCLVLMFQNRDSRLVQHHLPYAHTDACKSFKFHRRHVLPPFGLDPGSVLQLDASLTEGPWSEIKEEWLHPGANALLIACALSWGNLSPGTVRIVAVGMWAARSVPNVCRILDQVHGVKAVYSSCYHTSGLFMTALPRVVTNLWAFWRVLEPPEKFEEILRSVTTTHIPAALIARVASLTSSGYMRRDQAWRQFIDRKGNYPGATAGMYNETVAGGAIHFAAHTFLAPPPHRIVHGCSAHPCVRRSRRLSARRG